MKTVSPITGNNNIIVSDTFLSADIVALYRQQLGIDVSRFFSNERFYLYQCKDTGYKFYSENLDGDGKFYEALQASLGNDYYHDWKFENQMALDVIRPADTVLDIGCGTGNFLKRGKEKTPYVFGLELNHKAAEAARQDQLHVYNETIQQHVKHTQDFYDVVCIFQVLEHISDVKHFMEPVLKVLKKDGKLIIAVPNNDPYFLGYDKYCTLNLPPHHMGLWNKDVFEKFAEIFNLSILKTEYDSAGRVTAHSYARAKYLAGIKSAPGKHSAGEKLKMIPAGMIALPATLLKKFSKGLNGSHIAVLFQKK